MSLKKYYELESVVPDVPELLLEGCSQDSAFLREKIIQQQRFSLLMLLLRKNEYPISLLPSKDHFLNLIHSPPEESLSNVTPQQVQFISLLVDFVIKNPNILLKAIQFQYKNKKKSKPIAPSMSRSNSLANTTKSGLFNSNHSFSINSHGHNNNPGLNNSAKLTEHNKDLFDMLCFSTIPAFFGHFSSSEHLFYSFPFFCNLVGTLDEEIIDTVLIPYYCNGCTFRFIESVYAQFGKPFCHDVRLDSQQVQYDVLKKYIKPLLASITQSYPLLPHTHQFLLKFMQKRGRDKNRLLNFFINHFLMRQLLRYVNGTPFTLHFMQLKEFVILIRNDLTPFYSIMDVMNSPSFFEVPSAFTVFNDLYSQILLTPIDVHVMMAALAQVNELPKNVQMFKNQLYLKNLNLTPFWVKLYSKKSSQIDSSFNWRQLVFSFDGDKVFIKKKTEDITKQKSNVDFVSELENKISSNNKEVILNNDNSSDSNNAIATNKNDKVEISNADIENDEQVQAFERMYRQLKSHCEYDQMSCINFLLGNCFLLEDKMKSAAIKKNLGTIKYDMFFKYVVKKEMEDLVGRSRTFESYLVHSLALRNLKDWHLMVESSYITTIMPIMQENLEIKLKSKQIFNSISKQIQQHQHSQLSSSNDFNSNSNSTNLANSIENLISTSMGNNVNIPLIRQLLLMMIVQKFLHIILPNNMLKRLQNMEKMWITHLMQTRETIILPEPFRNSKGNQTTALMFNRRLWSAIEHLCSLKQVKFEWSLNLILDTLSQLDEINNAVSLLATNNDKDNSKTFINSQNENSVVQFALAFCDTPLLISRFVIINIFVVKQKSINNVMTNENKDLLLWSGLESSILKLLSKNEKLLTSFLAFQEELNFYQI
ncbi:hypothetical protein M9Y10_011301 [Tritrichomonas musculus]|uniref:Uncharacterized protein n=1 Tax=Tritrichomonas musculus TaxID=1915356 RepID=A0ABR2IJ31_9EUKA